MTDSDLHTYAGVGTVLVVALLATPVYVLAGNEIAPGVRLTAMESIEAELAMKSDTKKQPDKPPPPPRPADENIGGDPNARPDLCKQDADCGAGKVCKKGTCVVDRAKPDSTQIAMPPRRYTDDEATSGEASLPDLGQFDGSERGFAAKSSGHPYMQELAADVHEFFEFPEILKGQGSVEVCVHVTPDGKMAKLKTWTPSGNAEIDDSGARAVKRMMDKRNENPEPVPTELLAKGVTTKYLCFRLTP